MQIRPGSCSKSKTRWDLLNAVTITKPVEDSSKYDAGYDSRVGRGSQCRWG